MKNLILEHIGRVQKAARSNNVQFRETRKSCRRSWVIEPATKDPHFLFYAELTFFTWFNDCLEGVEVKRQGEDVHIGVGFRVESFREIDLEEVSVCLTAENANFDLEGDPVCFRPPLLDDDRLFCDYDLRSGLVRCVEGPDGMLRVKSEWLCPLFEVAVVQQISRPTST